MVTTVVAPPRMWLVIFGDGGGVENPWWCWFLPRGYRHVAAASYYADVGHWVYVDPGRGSLLVEGLTPAEFGPRLGALVEQSSVVLRVRGKSDRARSPRAW